MQYEADHAQWTQEAALAQAREAQHAIAGEVYFLRVTALPLGILLLSNCNECICIRINDYWLYHSLA